MLGFGSFASASRFCLAFDALRDYFAPGVGAASEVLMTRTRRPPQASLHVEHMARRPDYGVGVRLIASMPNSTSLLGNLRMVRRGLPTDGGMASVAICAIDRLADHRHNAGVTLVKIKGDNLGVSVNAEDELRQVVDPMEKPSKRRANSSI